MQLPTLTAAGHTEQGKRSQNEDAYCLDSASGVFVVADGMGGLLAGEEASKLAVELLPGIVAERLAAKDRPNEAVAIALERVSQVVLTQSKSDPRFSGMGSTALVALVHGPRVYVGNLGDSPAYLVRGGRTTRLTHDHTVAEELVRKGLLTPDQAKVHPWRNRLFKSLRCAEMQELTEVHDFPQRPGDWLVLLSDGVANFIRENEFGPLLAAHASVDIAARELTRLALERGSQDNVTAVVLAFH